MSEYNIVQDEINTLGRLGGTECGHGVREVGYRTFAAMGKGDKEKLDSKGPFEGLGNPSASLCKDWDSSSTTVQFCDLDTLFIFPKS